MRGLILLQSTAGGDALYISRIKEALEVWLFHSTAADHLLQRCGSGGIALATCLTCGPPSAIFR